MLKDRQIRTTEFKEDRVNSLGMALNGVLQGPRGQCQTAPSSSHSTAGPGARRLKGAVARALLSPLPGGSSAISCAVCSGIKSLGGRGMREGRRHGQRGGGRERR